MIDEQFHLLPLATRLHVRTLDVIARNTRLRQETNDAEDHDTALLMIDSARHRTRMFHSTDF